MYDEIYPGDFVRLIKPEFAKTFGQGSNSEGLRITRDDPSDKSGRASKFYFIPWDSVLKISETCDPLLQVGDLQSRPYPLLHINFYLEHKNSFEIINSKRDVENNS